jgi:hypothetical protein
MRTFCVCLFVLALTLAPGAAYAQAQSTPPQTYSITMASPMGPGSTIKVARDGSKLSLEQMVAKSKDGPGMHIRQIYDFATHKYWTMDLEGGPCVVSTYTSTHLPSMFDPIGGAAEMQAEFAKAKPVALRSETVNGIATRVYEMPFPEIKGKMRFFLEEKHNFVVKTVMIPAGGKEQTQSEITSLSYEKPPATLFVPPQNCRVQAGESSATGGRAETEISATAAGQKNLGAEQPAQKPAPERKAAAAPASRTTAPASAAQVTEVRAVSVQPSNYQGRSPAAFVFTFSVTANAATPIKYILLNQADIVWNSGALTFAGAGTKELKIPVKVGVPNGTQWEGSAKLQVYAPNKIESEPVKVSADCRAK